MVKTGIVSKRISVRRQRSLILFACKLFAYQVTYN